MFAPINGLPKAERSPNCGGQREIIAAIQSGDIFTMGDLA